ncbi:cytochrome P450 [Stachybotrys elegans]|uniref:Cytochrome P450 n=1 Tax=Stachybotrys elegans TaxID=80388 RepID=A0A8K0WMW3_9HYPO|nr:cytochrome P450 [Stachybotrys elegans]
MSDLRQLAYAAVAVGSFLLVKCILFIRAQQAAKDKHLATITVVGLPDNCGVLGWIRAVLSSVVSLSSNISKGYETFCQTKSRPFAVPNIWSGGVVYMLPASLLHLLNRPDREMARIRPQLDTMQFPYMFSDPDIYENVIHFDPVRKHMSKSNLDVLAHMTNDEMDTAFRAYWGLGDEFRTVRNWDVCGKVVGQAAMRALVGEALCGNQELLKLASQHSDAVLFGTFMLNVLPPSARPWLGPLVGLPAKYFQRQCLKILAPYIETRIQMWREAKSKEEDPQDFIQWLIARCAREGEHQLDAKKISLRLLALITMSVMGSVYVFSHCILDLYGSPAKAETIAALEEECRAAVDRHGSLSTAQAVGDLHRVDSALRESMRVSGISVASLARDVATDSLDLGNGITIPRGTRIMFPSQSMHMDPNTYQDPHTFDAFRFSRPFESVEPDVEVPTRAAMTTMNSSFLVWGYGKYGCPGRWFASQLLKQALAHVVLNYDVEVVEQRQPRQALLNIIMPEDGINIKIRRKVADKSLF